MTKIIKPPERLPLFTDTDDTLFLAGSIEMGKARNWQVEIEEALEGKQVTIFNPRRDDWDSSWVQSIDNPHFREQVEWEIEALETSRYIAMYFDPDTKAPITLLELGLFARTRKLFVCCPDGYWRKGNVEVVCALYGIPLVTDFYTFIKRIRGFFPDEQ